MSKQFLAILAILILGFFGFVAVQNNKSKQSPNPSDSTTAQASEHKIGAGKKGVTLVEYGDFQCPSCGAYFELLQEVKAKYGDDITFQFRNFPLTQIHPNAMSAHRAAEAAAKQDKFWQMHDKIYERQQAWSSSQNATQLFENYATELSLNMDKFKEDYKSSAVNAVINADMSAGKELKITGTPAFFINGEKIENPGQTLEEFSKTIDEAIAKANKKDNQ